MLFPSSNSGKGIVRGFWQLSNLIITLIIRSQGWWLRFDWGFRLILSIHPVNSKRLSPLVGSGLFAKSKRNEELRLRQVPSPSLPPNRGIPPLSGNHLRWYYGRRLIYHEAQ